MKINKQYNYETAKIQAVSFSPLCSVFGKAFLLMVWNGISIFKFSSD
jgi:hypothetical protein